MPWREKNGRLYGPGVFDMKSGIAQLMFALSALHEVPGGLSRPVKVLLVSDEEDGSNSSRAITETLARQCTAVLVCEPSGPGGAIKTARKGVGSFTVKVTGTAAHSGLDFDKGQSAILELAHQILAISQLTDLETRHDLERRSHSWRHAHQCSRCRSRRTRSIFESPTKATAQ